MSRVSIILWIASLIFGTIGWVVLLAGKSVTVSLLSAKYVTTDGANYMSAGGTIVAAMAGEVLGDPWNTVQIECWKPSRECRFTQAVVISGGMLFVDTDTFEIRTWQDGTVRAVDDSPRCVIQELRIDANFEEVVLVRTRKEEVSLSICNTLQPRFDTRLVDGIDAIRAMH